ncbi:gasdermin-A [Echinops telfairi]|uniref:Gasdermin-A n=1 Tax=Echinops telfairi TaxID=9371 RepID=A0ABM0ITR6_ECHTE|nr:gasdermin-A [Echinops telfairi]
MTMFENVTRALARQLNPRGDLVPLDSLIDFKRFHPFCLVLRKRRSTLFWGARYVHTDYSLLDLLEAGSSPEEPTDSGNFGFTNMLDARVEGKVDMPKTVKVTGTAGLSRNSTLEVQTLSVAPKALESLQEKRKLEEEHPFLKEMRDRGENLYVVMEVVETVQEVTLERAGKAEAGFSLPFFAPLGLQVRFEHPHTPPHTHSSEVGFALHPCTAHPGDCKDPALPPAAPNPEEKFVLIQASESGEEHENFKTLKEEVQRETQVIEKLSPAGQSSLLSSLGKLLGKIKDLQDLELALRGALDKGHKVTLEALPKDVLLSKEATGAVLYFVGALTDIPHICNDNMQTFPLGVPAALADRGPDDTAARGAGLLLPCRLRHPTPSWVQSYIPRGLGPPFRVSPPGLTD